MDAINIDSSTKAGGIQNNITYSTTNSSNYNEFVFNVGVGVMVVHESKSISVRVYGVAGYSSTYSPSSTEASKGIIIYSTVPDIFFSGRAWITESTTGLTLQAEITTTLINKRPFYGVTLSKALNFQSLGNIFSPIVPK